MTNEAVNHIWSRALKIILEHGTTEKPRDRETKEILGYQTQIPMSQPVLTNPWRKLGYKFMCAEAAWILSGDNRVATIEPYSKQIAQFSDDGVRYFGSYGPKIIDQLAHVIASLKEDQSTRQAVINIWRENPRKTKDIPCTLGCQFMIRKEKDDLMLHCFDTMRSSDIWLGWPYDIFNFSMLSAYIAIELRRSVPKYKDLKLGRLTLTAASQHLYKEHYKSAEECITADMFPYEVKEIDLAEFGTGQDLIDHLWDLANRTNDYTYTYLTDLVAQLKKEKEHGK